MELIIAARDWEPPASRFTADTMVGVHIGFAEVDMRERVKQAGGKWNRSHKVWELRYDQVVALKLEARIVEEEEASNTSTAFRKSVPSYAACRREGRGA